MKTVKEEISANILFYRKRAKLTQKKLADALGVKNNTISQWESGANSVDVEVLFKICEILNVGINDMFGEYAFDGDKFSQREKELIFAYRDAPDMQAAVDRLLGIEVIEEDTVRVFRAAHSENSKGGKVVDVPRSTIEKLKAAKPADEI